MAKVTLPLMSASAAGKIGDELIFDSRGYVKPYYRPGYRNTIFMDAWRDLFTDIQRLNAGMNSLAQAQLQAAVGKGWRGLIMANLLRDKAAYFNEKREVVNNFTTFDKIDWEQEILPRSGMNSWELFYPYACAVYATQSTYGWSNLLSAPAAPFGSALGWRCWWLDGMPQVVDCPSDAWTWSSGWQTSINSANYGGSERYTTVISAYGTMSFTGYYVCLRYTKRSMGKNLKVYVDSVLKGTINQYGATTTYMNEWTSPFLGQGAHTLKVEHGGSSGVVAVDALMVYPRDIPDRMGM